MTRDTWVTRAYAGDRSARPIPAYDWLGAYPAPLVAAPAERFGDDPEVRAAYPSTNEIAERHRLLRAGMAAGEAVLAARPQQLGQLEAELAALALGPALAGVPELVAAT